MFIRVNDELINLNNIVRAHFVEDTNKVFLILTNGQTACYQLVGRASWEKMKESLAPLTVLNVDLAKESSDK